MVWKCASKNHVYIGDWYDYSNLHDNANYCPQVDEVYTVIIIIHAHTVDVSIFPGCSSERKVSIFPGVPVNSNRVDVWIFPGGSSELKRVYFLGVPVNANRVDVSIFPGVPVNSNRVDVSIFYFLEVPVNANRVDVSIFPGGSSERKQSRCIIISWGFQWTQTE